MACRPTTRLLPLSTFRRPPAHPFHGRATFPSESEVATRSTDSTRRAPQVFAHGRICLDRRGRRRGAASHRQRRSLLTAAAVRPLTHDRTESPPHRQVAAQHATCHMPTGTVRPSSVLNCTPFNGPALPVVKAVFLSITCRNRQIRHVGPPAALAMQWPTVSGHH